VKKVALVQVLSEYFGFPCHSSFHQILHHHNHPGQIQLAIPTCRVNPTMRIKKKKKRGLERGSLHSRKVQAKFRENLSTDLVLQTETHEACFVL
jgi:hypothetical protein